MNYIVKEWKELSRGKGLWLSIAMVALVSVFLLLEARTFPLEQGFEVYLLSLYDMNVYLLPLLSLFLSAFAIMQEKEMKTLMMVMTKKESYRSFLLKKSLSIHVITLGLFIGLYFIMAVPMKLYLSFSVTSFLTFLLTVIIYLLIFNQIGIFIGSICTSRMQLVGAAVFTWFFFIFLVDLIFLYYLPAVSYDNVTMFSVFYFLDPLHAIRFFFETSLGIFSLEYMSRLMEKLVWMSPAKFLLVNVIIWIIVAFELAVQLHSKGEKF
ncbi:ABC transporter permease subunit [Anaerobacillus sp. MEB173]|uniref:ABC transporter permease subunit n=1 Tax=Anaerobacillus sp. MEB173 TaxID=3383345 RepID=UPI003F917633